MTPNHYPWKMITLLLISTLPMALAQAQSASSDESLMTRAELTSTGELKITPSDTSSSHDFDFLEGNWILHNRKLKTRLNHSTEWTEFEATVEMKIILNGIGSTDTYREVRSDGTRFEGIAVRLFNPKTRLWSIYWADSNIGVMDPPVVGSFEGSIGKFYCKDVFQGKPILVMFKWDKTDKDNPVWSQSFSPDNGRTWEMNHTNVSRRAK